MAKARTADLAESRRRQWYGPGVFRGRRRIFDFRKSSADRALRAAVIARDNFRCLNCGDAAIQADPGYDGSTALATVGGTILTLDHLVPVRFGGLDLMDNLQTLCRRCNSSKGVT